MIKTCVRCGAEAIGVFFFDKGCYCDPSTTQALCLHHAHKSGPVEGGSMILIEDLTTDNSFTRYWNGVPEPESKD